MLLFRFTAVLFGVFLAMVMGVLVLAQPINGPGASDDSPGPNGIVNEEDSFSPNHLIVEGDEIDAGDVLHVGVRSGDGCIAGPDSIEVVLNLSQEKPSERVALILNEACELVVDSVISRYEPVGVFTAYEMVGSPMSVPIAYRGWNNTGFNDPNPQLSGHFRYTGWTESEWNDFAGVDLAVTRVEFSYDALSTGLDLVGSISSRCRWAYWWSREICRKEGTRETASTIKSSTFGRFAWQGSGSFRHSQRATFTGYPNGRGSVRCWSSRQPGTGEKFKCEGDISWRLIN